MKHHKTLRRGFSVLLSLMMCLTMLPTIVLAEETTDHTHCVCGSKVANCHDYEEDVEWTAWESSDSLPNTAGHYYLTKDVTLTETWKPKNRETYLCLNGKNITANFDGSVITISTWTDFHLTDCADAANPGVVTHGMKEDGTKYTGRGVEIEEAFYAGAFYMYGGSISGNIITGESDQQGAGVMVRSQGSFQMYGGVIRDNKAVCTADSGSAQGGGVYSAYKFYMYGGTITGNDVSASNPQGGGVFVSGPAYMGGTPVIKGNTTTVTGQQSKPNNYTVSNYDGQNSGLNIRSSLKDGAYIGVNRASDSEEDFARGNGCTITASDAGKFVPDDENYIVLMGDDYQYGSLKLLERSAANVASVTIGGETTEYIDLQEALRAVIDSTEKTGTVKLLKDVKLANSITLEQGVNLTLDMNGHNLTAKKVKGDSFITIDQSKLNITGQGTIETKASIYDTKVNNTIHVKDGSVCTVGKDVSISNTYARVLYMSGNSECTVSGTLEGRTSAVEIRAGKLTIDDPAVLEAFGEYEAPTENGGGDSNIELGCIALAVSPLESDLPITVNIKGGTFIAKNTFMQDKAGKSLYEVDLYHLESPSKNVCINISGGEFQQPVQSLNDKLTLSGGSFVKLTASETLSALLAKNYGFKSIDGNNITLTEGQKEIENVTVDKLYTISFDANGGSGSMDAVTVVSGSCTLPECDFTAPEGLQFVGWAASESGEVISGATITVTEDTTLYAIWGINYGVKVNGVKVTSLNKDNVLGNGNVQYDPATKILYVKDFVAGALTVAGDGETIVNISDKLGAPAVGTLTVIDAKDVTVTANSGAPAIFGKADITCTGNITITNSKGMAVSAPLTVTNAQNVTVEGYGDQAIVGITDITCTGNVTITNSKGMAVSNPLTVNSAKDVTVTGNSSSAPAIAGTADITCTGKVMITNSTGIAVKSALTVKNAKDVTVTANSSSYPAIRGTADITCSGDVEITNSTGMAVNSGLTVKSAKDVTVTANTADSSYPAIGGTTDITCSGDVIISNSNGRAVGSGLKYQRGSDHGYTVKTGLSLDELTDYAVKEAGQDFTIDSLEASAVKISVGHTSDEWQNSSTQHWQVCTVCGDEFNRTDHTFSGRTCTVCGYTKPSSGSSSSGSTTVTPTEPEITTGGGTTVAEIETKVTTSGTTSKAAVSQDTLEKAIEAAGSAAEKAGTDTAVEIVVNTPAEATEVKVDLSAEGLGSFAASEAQSLTISTGVGTVTISPEAAASIAEQTGDDNVTVTISEVTRPENTLNEHQLAAVGDAQVYNLSVTGNGKYITDFDGGLITVSLPYMLKAGEKPNGVVVYYVDDQGSIKRVRDMYDVKTQSIIFTTNHFSFYMVRYESDAAAAARFTDVPEGSYYEDAVIWAVGRGITTGTTETTFSPDASCTRAQMVTFLWRAAGSPKADGSSPFTDVSPDAYYYDAVLWAVENGITSGTSATTFAPDATVTRDQTVTFMWRAAGSPAANGSGFSDVSGDAYYADAVAWAVENGITTGTGSGLFSPDDDCTRAQIVTFLYRYMGE